MRQYQIAVIDDDPFVVAHLKRTLSTKLPEAEVHGIAVPVAPAGYDVYIVDKDFEGASLGCDVVSRVRDVSPDALLVAYSAFLDKPFLRNLISKQCAGAFDKGSLQDLEEMIQLIRQFLWERDRGASSHHGLRDTVKAISSLLREWNLRLGTDQTHDTPNAR